MTNKELNESRQSIAAFIQKKRNEMGISQAELAEQTGMGIATIKRFEGGNFWIGVKQLIKLCDCLKLEVDFKLKNNG